MTRSSMERYTQRTQAACIAQAEEICPERDEGGTRPRDFVFYIRRGRRWQAEGMSAVKDGRACAEIKWQDAAYWDNPGIASMFNRRRQGVCVWWYRDGFCPAVYRHFR